MSSICLQHTLSGKTNLEMLKNFIVLALMSWTWYIHWLGQHGNITIEQRITIGQRITI